MKAINENRGASEPSAKKVTSAPLSKAPSENKNISVETPFRHGQAGNQPCLSFMPAMAGDLHRSEDPKPTSKQETGVDRMRDTVRKFRESLMYSVPSVVREQAVDTLNLLIRFDSSISLDESRVLMDAVKIIQTKGASWS